MFFLILSGQALLLTASNKLSIKNMPENFKNMPENFNQRRKECKYHKIKVKNNDKPASVCDLCNFTIKGTTNEKTHTQKGTITL